MHVTHHAGCDLHHVFHGKGPAALFLHGFPLDHTMWSDQLPALADLRECIAPDLRGFGRSEASTNAVLTMDQIASDAAAVLDARGIETVDLIGFSMGGYAALAFAEHYPKRLRSLVLIDTRAGADDAAGQAKRKASAERLVEVGRLAWGTDTIAALLAPNAALGARARMRTMIEHTPYETIVAAQLGMAERPDRTRVLATISVPTTVIVGELDALTPPDQARAMVATLPNAKLVVVPGAGHMSPIEAPEAVIAALRGHFQSLPTLG
ncbi:MAG: alpha/beta hydrolase [Planctomycetes bacterium]|nr:alpha/beta hydrolase [Planctomycetota bacterium]MCB9910261.1 alpha/beta hydrolase [Planctomycetota bacterium]HPF12896.1 alpha/beta hydrolase [Planctomycetota bacterium]HRV80832.1 alpha/beta hydrolase [Planctomycetota bacterium]